MYYDEEYLEVYFDKYCKKCKSSNVDETKDPCHECLSTPANLYSHKPINFIERDDLNVKKRKNNN